MTTLYRLLWLRVFLALDRIGWPLGSARLAPWLIGKAAGSKGVRVDREEM